MMMTINGAEASPNIVSIELNFKLTSTVNTQIKQQKRENQQKFVIIN